MPLKKTGKSKYKPEYCEMVLQSAARGETVQEFCASIMVARDTYYHWCESHSDWSDTVKIAKTIRQSWLLSKVRDGAFDPKVHPCNNGMVYLLALNNGLNVKQQDDDRDTDGLKKAGKIFELLAGDDDY